MTIITSNNNTVKVDMSALVGLAKTPFRIAYLMKDKSVLVSLDNKDEYVLVQISDKIFFKLDVNGVKGSPAIINGVTATTNEQLAELVAGLKNL